MSFQTTIGVARYSFPIKNKKTNDKRNKKHKIPKRAVC
jgi:hypothetical protein